MSDRAELNDNRDIEELLRSLDAEDREHVAPPSGVWDRIAQELSSDSADSSDFDDSGEPPHFLTPPERVDSGRTTADSDVPPAPVTSLTEHRRRRMSIVLGMAAALVLIVAVGALLVTRDDNSEVLAVGTLTYDEQRFDPAGATSSATVSLVDDDGGLVVRVDESDLPAVPDEDLEVWLIKPDDAGNPVGIVSLGLVDSQQPGSLSVPDDIDPAEYTVVDISIEPRDGDDTHSGRSILRGPFVTA